MSNYPYIFVHGMASWGGYDEQYKKSPSWGGVNDNSFDMIKAINDRGHEAYAASVGPFSSAWDRACELYAQLTGTVVDYGEAHSRKYGHDRYGYSYRDNQLMEQVWDEKTKLNLVGHSFGGATIRLFASLMKFGCEEEIRATGEHTSGLFKGGHNCINSIITLAAPHNGSQMANFMRDIKLPFLLLGTAFNFAGAKIGENVAGYTLRLGHFGLTPRRGQNYSELSLKNILNYSGSEDHCGYNLTIKGARELNHMIKTLPDAYYFSHSAYLTSANDKGHQASLKPSELAWTAAVIGRYQGRVVDGVKIDSSWAINDGLVPLASALYPLTESHLAYSLDDALRLGKPLERGKWYYAKPIGKFDHVDFIGTLNFPTTAQDYYFNIIDTVNNLD